MEEIKARDEQRKLRSQMIKKADRNRKKDEILRNKETRRIVLNQTSLPAPSTEVPSWRCSEPGCRWLEDEGHEKKHNNEWGRQVRRILVRDAFRETRVPHKTKKLGKKSATSEKCLISLMALITVHHRMNWQLSATLLIKLPLLLHIFPA